MSGVRAVSRFCIAALPKVRRLLLVNHFFRAALASLGEKIVNQEGLSILACHSFLWLHASRALWHDHVEDWFRVV